MKPLEVHLVLHLQLQVLHQPKRLPHLLVEKGLTLEEN
jgi:hypothetical protein